MRAHLIKNGIVKNTIIVKSLDFCPGLIDASNGGKIGDIWNGSSFTTPPIDEDTIKNIFIYLKTDFLTYLDGHYDLGTQATIQMAFMNPDSSIELKAKAKEVGDWILTVQTYYKAKKLLVLRGEINTTWDFTEFDETKPEWSFDDFIPTGIGT